MSRRLSVTFAIIFGFACLLLPSPAWSTDNPTIYFSTGVGGQILSIDGSMSNSTVIAVFNGASTLQGITVGPDGMIYASDTPNGRILRLSPGGPKTQTPTVVYDKSASAVPNKPLQPQALRFNGLDLYFTDQDADPSGGVWKLPGVTTATLPEDPTHIFAAGATGATLQGIAFSSPGGLLIVDQGGNKVLKSVPNPNTPSQPYTSLNVLIPAQSPHTCTGQCTLDTPVGIAVSRNGDIFVANSGAAKNILRFTFDAQGNSTGSVYVAFNPDGYDTPRHMGFDLSDKLYVVTGQDSFGDEGKVWRVDPPGGFLNLHKVVDLDVLCGGDTEPGCVNSESGIVADNAIGLAVPATSVVSPAQAFSTGSPTGTFDFGSDKMIISFPNIISEGSLTVTKKELTLGDFATLAGTFSGDPCIHYSREGGFCDVYIVSGTPPGFTPPVNIQLFYFTQDALADPVLLRAPDASATFTETVPLVGFTTQGGGNDPGMSGDSGGTSQYAAANQPLPVRFQNDAFCGFNSPIPPGKTFLAGQTVPVKFQIASSAANCNKGVFVTTARMQLGVVDQNGAFQVVQSTNTRDNRNCPNGPTPCNVFSVAGHQYTFNLSTAGYAGRGTRYFVTIFGEGVPPQTTSFTLQ